ncbi:MULTISPECIES: hypothetical protein, partial [Vibrio]|uniref:hypothetical protein n=1 Tax=Vibrio TaxID=662 RepID=UPI001CDD4DDE
AHGAVLSSPENQSGHRVERSGKKEKQKPRSPKTLPAGINCWLFWFFFWGGGNKLLLEITE